MEIKFVSESITVSVREHQVFLFAPRLKLAPSNGLDRRVSPTLSSEDGNTSSFQNEFFRIPDDRHSPKAQLSRGLHMTVRTLRIYVEHFISTAPMCLPQ